MKILQGNRDEGGLGLTNLKNRDVAFKIQWVIKAQQNEKIKEIANIMLKNPIGNLIWEVHMNSKDIGVLETSNNFWTNVFELWVDLNFNHVETAVEAKNQIIWLNSEIKIQRKPIWWEKWFKAGIVRIGDILDGQDNFMSWHHFIQKHQFQPPFTEYQGLLSAIPKHWKNKIKMGIEITSEKTNYLEIWQNANQKIKLIYRKINQNDALLHDINSKWQITFPNSTEKELQKCITNIFIITNYPKYRAFQYRLILKAIITNQHLYRYKITNTSLCTFCKNHVETIIHLFCECPHVKELWLKVQRWLKISETWTNQQIIFNNVTLNPKMLPNFIVLCGKQYIYATRCLQKEIAFSVLKSKIENVKNIEYHIAIKNDKLKQHCIKWSYLE